MIPPNDTTIDQFENVLHSQIAIEYFHDYLETLEEQESQPSVTMDDFSHRFGKHTNNFRLLALYMDIRCYESVIRKVKESKRYIEASNDASRKTDRSFKNSGRFVSDNLPKS